MHHGEKGTIITPGKPEYAQRGVEDREKQANVDVHCGLTVIVFLRTAGTRQSNHN